MTHLLLPRPARLRRTDDGLPLHDGVVYAIDGDVAGTAILEQRIRSHFADLGIRACRSDDRSRAQLQLALGESGTAESYRLSVNSGGIRLQGADPAGLFYGLATLGQWLRGEGRRQGALAPGALAPGASAPGASAPGVSAPGVEVPGVEIDDSPGFPVRGVMLDISRNKVPTLETLEKLIDLLADWKINHLQLYVEHTFAYRGHESVWQNWSPITPEEAVELDGYCAERYVELVPNQNSFGHLHRWLTHQLYRQLAECPEGIRHPFGDEVEPFSLCPVDPRSLDLLAGLYDQLLPCFRSRLFNVGLDETFDLGEGRSAAACAERGKGQVYLEYLREVHRLVSERDHRMLFWGDIVLEHPELVSELPADAVALAWGYEADHPFDENARRFAEAGIDFWLCGGTSSWLSLAGRTTNALGNLTAAARAGVEHGASGLLVTDWGDWGHLQPLPVSYLGFAAGAEVAWRPPEVVETDGAGSAASLESTAASRDWPALLDAHAFRDSAGVLGRCYVELGEVYRLAGAVPINSSALFNLLFRGEDLAHRRFDGLSVAALERCLAAIDEATSGLGDPRSERAGEREEGPLPAAEARWVAAMLVLAAEIGIARLDKGRDSALSEVGAGQRRDWSSRLEALREERQRLWLARHRPGGLDASLRHIDRLCDVLRS